MTKTVSVLSMESGFLARNEIVNATRHAAQVGNKNRPKDGSIMNPKRYLMIFGTRPEAIKLTPVWREMRSLGMNCRAVTLGQSHDLLNDTLKELGWCPESVWHGGSPRELLWGAEIAIEQEQPDYVIVQGDTYSAWAGAMAAHFAGVKVIHVEAGIRSGNIRSPWPEEGIRRQIDSISDVLFCPSMQAYHELMISPDTIGQAVYLVGNTGLVDIPKLFPRSTPSTATPGILITLHRRELEPLEAKAVTDAAYRIHLPVQIVQHPNKKIVGTIVPISRNEMLRAVAESKLVITDSGGLQEECEYLGKRCLVARHASDRGFSPKIRSFDVDVIEEDIYNVLAATPRRDGFDHANSAKRIAKILYDRDSDLSQEDRSRA